MHNQEIAETITVALEQAPGKSPRIVRDRGSQFVAKGWLHSALKYLGPAARHDASPETLLANKKREVTETGPWWKEVNKWGQLTGVQAELYRFSAIDLPQND